MRKIIGILVCLLVIGNVWSADYQSCSFGSTSAYIHSQNAQQSMKNASRAQTYGSMSAISASNFETLNSEGGACYNPARDGSAIHRVGRPSSGSGGTGVSDQHSPVGATPWLLMVLMACTYGFVIHMRRHRRV